MRCSCHNCGTYMTHSESLELGCVCPECGRRCKACLGTDSVVSRDHLRELVNDATLMRDIFSSFDDDTVPLEDDPTKWGDSQWED